MDLFTADQVAPFPDSGHLLYPSDLLSHRHNPQKLRPIRSIIPSTSSPNLLVPSPAPPLEPSLQMQDPVVSGSGLNPFPHHTQEPDWFMDDDDDDDDDKDDDDDDDDDDDNEEEDENSSVSNKESGSRKRRKMTTRKLADFAQKLVKKVMEKQEQMHNELMVMIEKKERERIEREEAWRREEMIRIKKDEEARAQERSRNLALISFIQNILGYEIQIPQVAEGSSKSKEGEVEANVRRDFYNDLSKKRWPDVEVQALITLRTSLEHKFRQLGPKGPIWEEISAAMHGMGYNRSAKKCKEKWENINKYYKRTKGNGKKWPKLNFKTCPYFNELEILYKNGLLGHGNALSNTNDVPKVEEKECSETS